jgi:hypothetical protein
METKTKSKRTRRQPKGLPANFGKGNPNPGLSGDGLKPLPKPVIDIFKSWTK